MFRNVTVSRHFGEPMLFGWRRALARTRLYQFVTPAFVISLVFGIAGQAISPATSLAASSAYSTAVLSDQPGAYWRLGETSGSTAADASGKGHTGWLLGVSGGATGALVGDADTAFWFGGAASVKDSVATTVGADFT